MAATSWKRAGKRAVRMAREISTRPVSSGSRSDSSVRRLNSQFIQKQHAVMRQADLSRPGWVPPPTSAGTDRE